ncbi:alpha-N-acetylgalactosaminide alpha-2,6-sialyltransferase 6 isoform X8 [Canis lupus baileyi]|uniref:alpha-N-acetylgalactosaminide alpha-2,6-sialyltransferase 6 isoform X8 n=1 Tax=Canis lupus baileyi TaxID=143281 RepID=UPI003B973129
MRSSITAPCGAAPAGPSTSRSGASRTRMSQFLATRGVHTGFGSGTLEYLTTQNSHNNGCPLSIACCVPGTVISSNRHTYRGCEVSIVILLEEMGKPRVKETLPSRCHQCVIVTSSSHLLGTKLGPEIERAECTIRMNDAPTTGYSADVGNKTTFRVVAHSSVFRVLRRPQEFVNRTPETVFIFWGPPNKMQKPQGSLVRVIQRAGLVFPNMEAYAVSPGRMRQFDDLFRGETGKDREKSHSWLSTGWFTMVIAVELCDHVHVYGMVPPDYCSQRPRLQRMPYHYYEPKGPDECVTYIQNEHSRKGNHHRFITEKRVFSSWAQLYGITFSHPSWT